MWRSSLTNKPATPRRNDKGLIIGLGSLRLFFEGTFPNWQSPPLSRTRMKDPWSLWKRPTNQPVGYPFLR